MSTFFNRLDAILTYILSQSEKNSFFKPGQTYLDKVFAEFRLHPLMSLTPSLRRCQNPYFFTQEQIAQIQQKTARINMVNAFADLKHRLVRLGFCEGVDERFGEPADLKPSKIFDSLKMRKLTGELITRLYRLEQME